MAEHPFCAQKFHKSHKEYTISRSLNNHTCTNNVTIIKQTITVKTIVIIRLSNNKKVRVTIVIAFKKKPKDLYMRRYEQKT